MRPTRELSRTPSEAKDGGGHGGSPPGSSSPGQSIVASILLVDDHPANLLALEGILEPLGQRLVRASSGEEALRRLLDEDFAVILLDVQMPGIDGLQTAALIKERERSRHIPIIFLTAISRDAAYVFKGYAHGAVDFLLKPFDPDILRSKVAVFVELYVRGARIKEQEALLRQREREALERASELRYRNLTDAMPLLIWAGDASGHIYLCNHEWYQFSGQSLRQTADGGFFDAAHPDDRARLQEEHGRCLRLGVSFAMEYRLRRASDGAYRWFLVRANPEYDAEGKVIGWIATGTDVDEQRRAGEALAQFKATLDATLDCVFIIDPQTLRLRYVNEGAVRQLGYSREELLQMSIVDVEPEFDRQRFLAMLEPVLEGRESSTTYITRHRGKNGSEIPVEVVAQHVAADGAPARIVAVVRDIAERQRTEQELRRANEAKDAFLAAASHELRTPLAAAKAQAQLALRRVTDAEAPAARSLGIIGNQINRMAKLVEDLLDISRLQVGRLSLDVARFDFTTLLTELTAQMQALTETHQLELDAASGLEMVADRGRIEQVVSNLVSNALRYSPKGGPVAIKAWREAGEVRVSVRDHGVGIPKEKQAVIFERFGRAHGSKYGGLGLGLTISQGIIEQHGGRIWVESSGTPGEGSTFHVALPSSAANT